MVAADSRDLATYTMSDSQCEGMGDEFGTEKVKG